MDDTDTVSASERDDTSDLERRSPTVSALHASPARVVLTEDGNTDGWVASETAVTLDAIR